jgi:hypothetical protein
MPGPRQNHPAGRFRFEQTQTLRGGGLHGRRRIGQRLAQRSHHRFVFPRFQQPRGFGADVFSRIIGQPFDQPQQAVRFFQICQLDQGNAPHTGIVSGQTRLQGEDVVVIGHSKK